MKTSRSLGAPPPGEAAAVAAAGDRNYDMLIAHLIEVSGWRPPSVAAEDRNEADTDR